jgi:hypothetical protein
MVLNGGRIFLVKDEKVAHDNHRVAEHEAVDGHDDGHTLCELAKGEGFERAEIH